MAERQRPVTIVDVARHAGVSQASVSRVLNGKPNVDPAIADAVRVAVAELGYEPSLAARSLVQGRNHTVAMVVPDLANPLFQGILKGLTLAADADGYRVLVADTDERAEAEEAVALEARRRCDAIVLCAPRMPESRLRQLVARLAPVVVVNRPLDAAGVPWVGVDYARGIHDLVDHLVALGHRRIVYLAGPASSVSNGERERGLAAARETHPGLVTTVVGCGSRLDDGAAAAEAVLAERDAGATAVLGYNDLVALGLLHRLAELGVDVPGELSIAGFDDSPFARYSTPPLTTMSVPRGELGAQVWQRLGTLIAGGVSPHTLLYRPRLEVRATTGRVRVGSGAVRA
ncbi:LacI family DNA-binding transcriptional regulator [Agromyces sp. SYSU T00194]|uniref:LacI family DNA-binding transcriptional regulator n=1 Tax=Agromyces chitinivorans TaxID=3158560 RepID=UPI003395DD9F